MREGLAVRITAVTQSTGIISIENWIYCHDVVSIWVVQMSFESDVVEVREFFGYQPFQLTLFEYVLLLIPIPRLVDFSEVFNNQ